MTVDGRGRARADCHPVRDVVILLEGLKIKSSLKIVVLIICWFVDVAVIIWS